jgi:DNA primase
MDGSPVQLIKEKLTVQEVLKGYIELQPAGRNFKALCPFHHEKSPSFMVSPDRQSWHCFGCNEGGDIFSFVMKYEGLEFGEALKILAEKAGIELRRVSPMEYKHFGLLYDINTAAKDFFRKELAKNEEAKAYLKERGLTSDTVNTFEIGWAPVENDALSRHLVQAGFTPDDIIRAGVTLRSDRGMMFDRFRGRVMFPISNHAGKVVGFTGRIFPKFDTGEVGKYVNSPETPVFQKSRILYGFSVTKKDIREIGAAFLVEGQMDFLMSWQSGVKNAVATSGTALSLDHLQAIRRVADRLVLSFDNDTAGYNALERAIDLAERLDFGVGVAVCEGYKDPAEAVQKEPDYIKNMIERATPAPQFYFDRYLPESVGDLTDRGYLLKLRRILEKLRALRSEVERDAWLKKLSTRTGVSETVLIREMENLEKPSREEVRSGAEAKPASRELSRRELLTEKVLSYAAARNDFTFLKDVVLYFPNPYGKVYEALAKGDKRSADPEIDALLDLILLEGAPADEKELQALLAQLRQEYVKDRRQELTRRIKELERSGAEEDLKNVLAELAALPSH